MPYKKELAKKRKHDLTDSLRHYFETGDYRSRVLFPHCPGRLETFVLAHPDNREQLRERWVFHREEIFREWKMAKRRGHPWAEKEFDDRSS